LKGAILQETDGQLADVTNGSPTQSLARDDCGGEEAGEEKA